MNQCTTHQDCGTVLVCQPNETKCLDTKTLQTCKSAQTGWLTKTCEYGCENKACKAKPLLADEEICNSNSECQSGQCFASAAYYQGTVDANGLSATALYGSVKRCHQFTPQDYKNIQAAENQGNLMAGMVALSFVPGVGPVLQFVGAASNAVNAYYTCSQISEASQNPQVTTKQLSQLKTQCGLYIAGTVTSTIAGGSMAAAGNQTLTTAQQLAFSTVNLTDSAVNTAIADQQRQIVCAQNPSSSGCTMAYVQEGLGIGGLAVGAANTATQGNQYLTSQIDDLFGDTSNFRLTNVDTPTTSLDTAINMDNQLLFAEGALGTTGRGTYTSLGNQRLTINPSGDQILQQYMADAAEYLRVNRTDSSIPRAKLLNDFVNSSLQYATPGDENLLATRLRERLYSSGKPVELGDFIENRTGVCREYAACLHAVLADQGKPNQMVVGQVNSVEGNYTTQDAGRHAWVEFIDTRTGQWMVADPTNGFVMPRDEAYANMFLGVSDVKRQVFVWPEGTPLLQRMSGKITP